MTPSARSKLAILLALASLLAVSQVACGSSSGSAPATETSGGNGNECDSPGIITPGGAEPLQCGGSVDLQVAALEVGASHNCALMSNGGVRCWGNNDHGQLGDGTLASSSALPPADVITGVKAVAAGDAHNCALTANGGVRCWGNNTHGQLGDGATTDRTVPSCDVLRGVKAIAAGRGHTCALLETGGVRCWGWNYYGQLGDGTTTDRATPPSSDVLTGVTAIAAGGAHTCALMETGELRCWGSNYNGQLGSTTGTVQCAPFARGAGTIYQSCKLTPPDTGLLTDVKAVTLGDGHTCALLNSGGVRCWGLDFNGQLGDPENDYCCMASPIDFLLSIQCSNSPQSHNVLEGVQAIAAGWDRTCALMTNGGVRCWGGDRGCSPPPMSDILSGAQAIAAGGSHACALMDSGGVRCWGSNNAINIRTSTTNEISDPIDTSMPPMSDVLTGVAAIAMGSLHTCALMDSGGVRCWGDDWSGQVGDGGNSTFYCWFPTPPPRSGRCRATPTDDIINGVVSIAAGGQLCASKQYNGYCVDGPRPGAHTCALTATGGVRCWGDNLFGQLGDGTTLDRTAPPSSDAITGAKAVAVGRNHTCALMETGGVRCWGRNQQGQLGDGNTVTCKNSSEPCPTLVPPSSDVLSDVRTIAAGGAHTCALMETGGVRCWGSNRAGQLGDGTTTDSLIPPNSDVLTEVRAIAANGDYTCALTDAGGVRCWGGNAYGQLGDGTTTNSSSPPITDVLTGVKAIVAGGAHTCALTDAGGVRCWGDNGYGQLGDGTTIDSLTPPTADVLTGVKSISAGGSSTCALMETGGVRCWGDNRDGELGNDESLGRTTPVQVMGTCE